ncbi:hypothetical protein OSB04_un000799 [Centaurea solstitialis]|uniref:Uncharacterized protein n=1 Tax=Centaurea solstitialis TaxID=347529 RepID=A0AA38S3G1_9ASTR|nr:hypothetical protein OSB04_un000799 [Centaurea solstitialis]
MASTVTSTNNLSLRSILEKDKLTGSNFLDWERNLMIVLRHERKWYVLEEPLGEAPPANAPAAARNAHKKHSDDLLDVACLIFRDMFQTRLVQNATMPPKHSMSANDKRDITSNRHHTQFTVRRLQALRSQYNMNNMEKTIAELHSMLKTAELNMGNKNKTKDVLMVKDGGVKRRMGKLAPVKEKDQSRPSRVHPRQRQGQGQGQEGRNHSSTQQLRKVAVLHIQELEVSPGSYDQLLNNSYKCCRLKVAQIFDRVANIGRDPRLRLLLGMKS